MICTNDSYLVGVTGAVYRALNRPANLWEVPGIDDVMAAVR